MGLKAYLHFLEGVCFSGEVLATSPELEKGILNPKKIIRQFSNEVLTNLETIVNENIWEKHAYYNICLYYLRLWCKIKEVYSTKIEPLVYKNNIETVYYTLKNKSELNKDNIMNIVENHWNKYNNLFYPLLKIKYSEEDNNIVELSLENLFNQNYLHFIL